MGGLPVIRRTFPAASVYLMPFVRHNREIVQLMGGERVVNGGKVGVAVERERERERGRESGWDTENN